MLAGHIGDGRMGYKNQNGDWLSIMTPHKGEEANQTIFMMNAWDDIKIPTMKLSGVSVPEVRIIKDVPNAVAILSDGCENFSWNCLQINKETNKMVDKNTPYDVFWNSLIDTIDKTDKDLKMDSFLRLIDNGSETCRLEQDDRTLMLGLYNWSK